MTPSPLPRRYSRDQAAELLGISTAQLGSEIAAGRLGCYRRPGGRKVTIGEHHLAAYRVRAVHPGACDTLIAWCQHCRRWHGHGGGYGFGAGDGHRVATSPGASSVPANRPPIITQCAPAASALATSPE